MGTNALGDTIKAAIDALSALNKQDRVALMRTMGNEIEDWVENHGGGGSFSAIAGEDGIATGYILAKNGDTSEVIAASNNDLTRIKVVGVAKNGGNTGATIVVSTSGVVTGYSGLVVGEPVYLGVDGGVTATIPSSGIQFIIGTAITTTSFLFCLDLQSKEVMAVLVHQVADNTSGGSTVANAWTDLPLTDEVVDDIGVALASNTVTLPAGTYDIDASHVFVNYNRGMIRLYNVTAAAEIPNSISVCECSEAGTVSGNNLQTKIRVTFSVATQIKMQYYVTYAYATHGLGAQMDVSPDHVAWFGRMIIKKVGGVSNIVRTFPEVTQARAVFQHTAAAGTNGGSSVAGSRQTLQLDSKPVDEIGCTLSANIITLPAGTYLIKAWHNFYVTSRTRIYLYNVTTSTDLKVGLSSHCDASGDGNTLGIETVVTSATSFQIKFQYRCESVASTNGLGVASNWSEAEIFGEVVVERLGDIKNIIHSVSDVTPAAAIIQHTTANGTHGGTNTAGAWTAFPFNSEILDEIGVAVASNQITIPAGTYKITANHQLYSTNVFRTRLYNVTAASTIAYGKGGQNDASIYTGNDFPPVVAFVTFAVSTIIQYEYYVQTAKTSVGLGYASSYGSPAVEIYGEIIIEKLGEIQNIIHSVPDVTPATAIFRHTAANNIAGGTATAGSWLDLPITDKIVDEIGVSFSSNIITVQAGTYRIRASHLFFAVNQVSVRLYNVTTSSVMRTSENGFYYSTYGGSARCSVEVEVTFSVDTQFKFQYYCSTTESTDGLGRANNFSQTEVYGEIIVQLLGEVKNIVHTVNVGAIPRALIEDQQAATVHGGTTTAGAWYDCPMNAEPRDDIGVTLSSNIVTVPAGTYKITGRHFILSYAQAKIRLYNVTAASVIKYSESCRMDSGYSNGTVLEVHDVVTFAVPTQIKLQYRVSVGTSNTGLGLAWDVGEINIYGSIELEKYA